MMPLPLPLPLAGTLPVLLSGLWPPTRVLGRPAWHCHSPSERCGGPLGLILSGDEEGHLQGDWGVLSGNSLPSPSTFWGQIPFFLPTCLNDPTSQ